MSVPACRKPGLSSLLSLSRSARSARWPAVTGVARSWVYTLLARYRADGEAAFEPRSRRLPALPG
jgi:hypothetical protein